MNSFSNSFLLIYAGLFPIVNPVGSAPIFLGMTRQCSDEERNALSRRVAINSLFLLLGALFIGSHVIEFFGVTVPVVRVAGGLVVTAFGWQLLQTGGAAEDTSGAAAAARRTMTSTDAFYPLTMPLTVGPGSISVAITYGSQRPPQALGLTEFALLAGGAAAGVLALAVTVYVCYRYAERTVSMLGKSGTNVLVRLSAFILLCIGIEIIWSGASVLFGLPKS
jgi:multiple antibiotic resistance protein